MVRILGESIRNWRRRVARCLDPSSLADAGPARAPLDLSADLKAATADVLRAANCSVAKPPTPEPCEDHQALYRRAYADVHGPSRQYSAEPSTPPARAPEPFAGRAATEADMGKPPTPEPSDDHQTLYRRAYAEGTRAGLERAAEECERVRNEYLDPAVRGRLGDAARLIRALANREVGNGG